MANKLFKDLNVSNKVSRNGFDLSHKVKFTAKCGELLPVFHLTTMPGDKFRFNLSHFTRTSPTTSTPRVEVREYFDLFFVPYRQLWRNAPQVFTDNMKNPTHAIAPFVTPKLGPKFPVFSFDQLYMDGVDSADPAFTPTSYFFYLGKENEFAFNRGFGAIKLLNHLGYCNLSPDVIRKYQESVIVGDYAELRNMFIDWPDVSMFPLLAYNKIYYDFFRNSQWENNVPYNFNVDYIGDYDNGNMYWPGVAPNNTDYWDNPTMFDLRYANYPKDLLFGIIPDAQYGDASIVEVDMLDKESANLVAYDDVTGDEIENPAINDGLVSTSPTLGAENNLNGWLRPNLENLSSQFSVLSLRKAQFLQRYKEIMGSGDLDYSNIVRKIFNQDVSAKLAGTCYYLGGSSSDIKFSDVENTNLVDSAPVIKSKGIGSQNGEYLEFENQDDFGIIMCIYHTQPVVDYSPNGFDFDVLKTELDDYANPVFDKLGFVELPSWYFYNVYEDWQNYNSALASSSMLGYTSRYFDYKTRINRVLGDFLGTRKDQIAAVSFNYLDDYADPATGELNITYTFFKVNPHLLDPIFALKSTQDVSTDQFEISVNVDINSVRSLDYLGVPFV